MRAFNNSKVEIGHFESQGKHSGSDLSYVDLMQIANLGINGPPRRPLRLLQIDNKNLSDSKFNTLMKLWGTSNYTRGNNEKLLQGFGIVLAKKEKAIFGKTGPMMPPTTSNKKVGAMGPTAPLVDTGELRSKVSYKTSISKVVKES